jgi:adenine/guanine phosphoribosyltransferase-like PRPP-binding protein
MSYIDALFDPAKFAAIVDRTCKALSSLTFDTIVFRGFSGALVGPLVALQLGKRMALVRKQGDAAHSDQIVEGAIDGKYIILDDFIDTGETVRKIVMAVKIDPYKHTTSAECVGVYMWHDAYQRERVAAWHMGSDDSVDSYYNGLSEMCGGVKILN